LITQSYHVPAKTWQVELEVKRSKFLTFAANAVDRAQAEGFIRNLREKHPQANHVCWAYIAGAPNTTIRSMSDDGEPSGTAGMPMLKVLEHSGYGDIVVAVVRYFGGTKLGTGGLQRAYSDAVSLVLTDLPLQLKVDRTTLHLTYDYTHDGSISRLLERYDVEDINSNYAHQVTLNIAIASSELSTFKTELTNITAGHVEILPPDAD
jgi:uncharacterized YigZ family protein